VAQLNASDFLKRIFSGDASVSEFVLAQVNRTSGVFNALECLQLDFKRLLDLSDEASVAEIARDVLGFSNTEGGLIVLGVSDIRQLVGHDPIDTSLLHSCLGPYLGTRVDYELIVTLPSVGGFQVTIPVIVVHRSRTAYPHLLRKDIPRRGALGPKVKYLKGSLFYRDGAETRVEPTGGDIDARASELKFTGASPRTRSSFFLEEDRPQFRFYSHINDRFVGREQEVSEVLARFDDPRGRGVSVAGLGGMGKTELAIEIVKRLYLSGKFQAIYSGSAKTTILGPFGPQQTDPFFLDFSSFLRDLGAWLGIDLSGTSDLTEMRRACLSELIDLPKTLMFVDNLETVTDGRVFSFLDNELPANVWLLTTSRVHKVKNYIYAKQLESMTRRDAAHLLRHELKRQGLEELSDTPIAELENRAEHLRNHPLSIRWHAWYCKRDISAWQLAPGTLPQDDIETFCVAHTLSHLPPFAQRLLAAMAATDGQLELVPDCLESVSGITGHQFEYALYELETAGLSTSQINDETGQITFNVTPLATGPAREMARKNHWESDFARGLKDFSLGRSTSKIADPLTRDLLDFDPRKLERMSQDERDNLKRRIDRAISHPHAFKIELTSLKAECERHSGNVISADDLYRTAADEILKLTPITDERYQKILLEAATVAKLRSFTEPQLRRAIKYLEVVQSSSFSTLRVLGTLAELSAMVGDSEAYNQYKLRVTNLRDRERPRFSVSQISALNDALTRADDAINARRTARS
jgi:hypothetical protein